MPHNTIQKFNSPRKQGGATLIGMAFIAAALIFVAIVVMKMAPSYIEYLSVKKVMQAMGQESLSTMSKKEIMESFEKRRSIAYVDSVTASDLTIEKNSAGDTVVSVQYQIVKPIVANVSVVMDFDASSNSK